MKGDKYELLVPNALNVFLMTEDDLKFGIRYLQWLLYKVRSFFPRVKRSYKASEEVQAFAKAIGAQRNFKTAIQSHTRRKTRKKGVRAMRRMDMPIRSI